MIKLLLFGVSMVFIAGTCFAELRKLNAQEKQAWLKYTLPLPKEIRIDSENLIAPGKVGFRLQSGAGDIEKNAVTVLKKFIENKTGVKPGGEEFKIFVGVADREGKVCGIKVENIERLKHLPNNDQAYTIQSSGNNKLVIAALNPKGIYYGIVTLKQLLSRKINKSVVAIPTVGIIDWPDLKYRGTWCNYLDNESIAWESQIKINFCDRTNVKFRLSGRSADGPSYKDWKIEKPKTNIDKLYAFNRINKIDHFNFAQWHKWLKKYYPELLGKEESAWQRAKGDPSGPPRQFLCPCASNPLFEDLLASMMEAGARAGLDNVACWTTEFYGYCGCDKCKGKNQYVLETRALINAWERIKKKYPDFEMIPFYSFTKIHSETTDKLPSDTWDKVVAELMNSDVKTVIRACYKRGKNKENPPFEKLAKKGKCLISFTLVNINSGLCSDVSGYKKRMNDLINSKWQGGIAFDAVREININSESYIAFKLAAIAEWGWNSKGRNLAQLAEAWATINNYKYPEKFVKFILLMEKVGKQTEKFRFGFIHRLHIFRNVFAGKQKWTSQLEKKDDYFKNCREAIGFAKEIGNPQWILDANTAMAYLEVNYAARKIISAGNDGKKLETAITDFKVGMDNLKSAAKNWNKLYSSKLSTLSRFNMVMSKSANSLKKEMDNISAKLKP